MRSLRGKTQRETFIAESILQAITMKDNHAPFPNETRRSAQATGAMYQAPLSRAAFTRTPCTPPTWVGMRCDVMGGDTGHLGQDCHSHLFTNLCAPLCLPPSHTPSHTHFLPTGFSGMFMMPSTFPTLYTPYACPFVYPLHTPFHIRTNPLYRM